MRDGRGLAAVLLSLAVLVAASHAREAGAPLVVRGGTLIDGTGTPPLSGAVVVVRDGRIAAVGPADEVRVPAGARRLDAEGRWILPGLVDAHVHYSQTGWFDGRPDAADVRDRYPYAAVMRRNREDPERYFRAYICSGVTATFDVGGYPWTRRLRARGERDPSAPRTVAAGALLSTIPPWINLPDQKQLLFMADEGTVREIVESHSLLGSGAIKVWFIVPSSWTRQDSTRMAGLVRVAGRGCPRPT